MDNIIAFPRLPWMDARTPRGVEVIVAPLAGAWVAWVRLPGGRVVALESTQDRAHVLRDATAYADRFGILLTIRTIPLSDKTPDPALARGGDLYVWPNPEDGGSWCVEHVSASGDASAMIATAFSFGEAVALAREAAQRLSATFVEGGGSLGGDAA